MSFQLSGSAPEIYENTMVPLWFGRWAEELVSRVSLASGENVLDVACGTGVTTRLAKRAVGAAGQVHGLDINAAMLAKARELALHEDITWIENDVAMTGLRTDAYDAVISQHGYHYFPDQPAALKEFRRVLVPSGRLALSIWDGHSVYTEAVCSAVEKYISPEIARKQRSQRETPTAEQLSQELSEAGFSDVVVVRQELSINVPLAQEFVPLHLGSMPIAGAYHALTDDGKTRLVDDVESALAGYVNGNQIVYKDAVNVVMGRGKP